MKTAKIYLSISSVFKINKSVSYNEQNVHKVCRKIAVRLISGLSITTEQQAMINS